ncbi:hypothetical protein VL06_05535 [Rossellomorea marisflavi]|nr:hypothetical protein VL03_14365 [Rossellomorea marisflavi]KML07360.1 hypothetical protein VL06_05535 [Rossellomorea marisflavi]KML34394.1 hypothetical protein VL12_05210 [Rossellomorea marisflavi]
MKRRALDSNGKRGMIETPQARGGSTPSPWKASARSAMERSIFSLIPKSLKGTENDSADAESILLERVVPATKKDQEHILINNQRVK